MSKTPDEIADEYLTKHFNDEQTAASVFIFAPIYREVFLDGYKAAKDELLTQFKSLLSSCAETSFHPNHTAWQIFDTLKGNQAAKDQLADAGKVINSSNNSNGWISVKERLPKHDEEMLVVTTPPKREIYHVYWDATRCVFDLMEYGHLKLDEVSHWCNLPEAPKEEG